MRTQNAMRGSVLVAMLAIGSTAASSPATAQSLFDALFGTQTPMQRPPGAQRLAPQGGLNMRPSYSIRQFPAPRRGNDDDDEVDKPDRRRGGHHTVCVRLCDGFYWPVSYSAPRSKFYRDANVCSASCGAEAKLFHYPSSSTQMQDAVDLTGRAYTDLPAAFKYRKTLVQGCTCKPEPWSPSEMDRHRIYALNEAAAKGSGQVAAAPAASPYPIPPPSGTASSALVSDATDLTDTPPRPDVAAAAAPPVAKSPEAAPTKAAPTRKPLHAKYAETSTPRTRQRSRPQPVRLATRPAPASFGSFWGGGPSQYTWPGDPPTRTR